MIKQLYKKCYELSTFWLVFIGNQKLIIVSSKSTDVRTIYLYSICFTNEELIKSYLKSMVMMALISINDSS